jgi:hypothetical protein
MREFLEAISAHPFVSVFLLMAAMFILEGINVIVCNLRKR